MSKPVVVLGATGSIGIQTLEVCDALGLEVRGIAARNPSEQLGQLMKRYPEAGVAVAGGSNSERAEFNERFGRKVGYGSEAVVEMATSPGSTVVNGIVGAVGLKTSVAALEAGNRLALANKESLVAGGPVVIAALARGGGELLPVDSEHSAVHQCLLGEDHDAVSALHLTASGGPFHGMSKSELTDVTPQQALRHPTWEMGPRITVDSATMFNKGLEIIEAHFLFDMPYEKIRVVVHPQSIVHSLVEYLDGSFKAHVGHADMRIPIQYALTSPGRAPSPVEPFALAGNNLEFMEVDHEVFPAIALAYEAGRAGGSAPACLNAADEIAVEAFLQGRLGFLGIATVVEQTLEMVEWHDVGTVEDVLAADERARQTAAALVAGAC